jgi:hypothetical protein
MASIKDRDTLLSPANRGKSPRVSHQVNSLSPLHYLREASATWRLAILGTVLGVPLIGIGVYLTDVHHSGGVFVLVAGAIVTLLSIVTVLIAWRRAKKGLLDNLSRGDLPTKLPAFSIFLFILGIRDALSDQFSISSAVLIALGCALYAAGIGIGLHRGRLRRNDRNPQQATQDIG